jgi:hypothetical protein
VKPITLGIIAQDCVCAQIPRTTVNTDTKHSWIHTQQTPRISDSSSLDNSIDITEAPSYYSKSPNYTTGIETSGYDDNDRYRNKYYVDDVIDETYRVPNQYNQKPGAYGERNKGTQQSCVRELKHDDRKKAPCDEK